MVPEGAHDRYLFCTWQFYSFLQDVLNKIQAFEVDMDPNTDPKRYHKSLKIEKEKRDEK